MLRTSNPPPASELATCAFAELRITDAAAFRHVPLYAKLKARLLRDEFRVRVLPASRTPRWDQAVLLNLTFWGAGSASAKIASLPGAQGDVLEARSVPADVVCHMAWHHLARLALPQAEQRAPSAAALFLGESIASAFDVYWVGELLRSGQQSEFLDSQVARMAETAQAAGASKRAFQTLLGELSQAPRMAFADLRELLFDTTLALHGARDLHAAYAILRAADAHPFAMLLPRFELSNWVLYARAYARRVPGKRVRAIDAVLREVDCPLSYLEAHWV